MSRKFDEKLAQLKKAEQRFVKSRISTPKIQRVPLLLRRNDKFVKYCTPKMISFGPIHHGSEILKEGEHYKLLCTSKFVAKYNENQDSDEVTQVLLKRIEDNMEELKKEFADDMILEGKYDDNDLAWMLFVDGCSLLHFMENLDIQCPEALNLMLHHLLQICTDVILLENQLPRSLLEMLSRNESPTLEFLFFNVFNWGERKLRGSRNVIVQNPKPIHLLDYNRSIYLNQQDDGDKDNNFQIDPNVGKWYTYKNIRDLKRAGIRMIPNLSAKNPFA
ncbi:uncharacterized protein LOC109806302 [Cajanus cajan]|uniref:UPF0481 protein At3g47200 family n=1 Tax=Cajanus cajan TaxID=3821 RepID=A0A151SYP5_CAJCA|nr:uncharacterized protein LOC109806302 [Cajanus cajan]KYP59926.1 UPF0481 protein At3g47200 family [Cajanus cajan]